MIKNVLAGIAIGFLKENQGVAFRVKNKLQNEEQAKATILEAINEYKPKSLLSRSFYDANWGLIKSYLQKI